MTATPSPADAEANPVRVVLPFPAGRIAQIAPANHRMALVYRGEVKTYEDPEDLRQRFFPLERVAKGDQVVVIHAGAVHTYASPEALNARIRKLQADRSAVAWARRMNIGWQIVTFGVGMLVCLALVGLPA